MNVNWKNWCRFCANAGKTIKLEPSRDLEYIFKISDGKMCDSCSIYLSDFQSFLERTRRAYDLLQEIDEKRPEDLESLNEFRQKFDFEPIEIDVSEDLELVEPLKMEYDDEDPVMYLDIKEEPSNNFADEKNEEEQTPKPKKKYIRRKTQLATKVQPRNSYNSELKSVLKLQCHKCSYKEPDTMGSLIKHCKKFHNCRPEILCVCGFTISNYGSFIKHRKRCFRQFEVLYECDYCGRRFLNLTNLESHMNLRHKSDSEKFECKTCGKVYDVAIRLRKHEVMHLPHSLKYIFQCPSCPEKFSFKSNLNTHIKRVHKGELPIFACHICTKVFNRKLNLTAHLETHLESNTYECDVCNKKYKTSNLLYCHKKIHGPRNYVCKICDYRFPRKSGLNKHMERHDDTKKHHCTYEGCSSQFKSKTMLKEHMNIHFNIRPYACPFCDQAFSNRSNCIKHSRNLHPVEYAAHENDVEKRRVKKIL